jgi:hypothetical protein
MAVLRGVIDRHEVVTETLPGIGSARSRIRRARDRPGKAVKSSSKRSMNQIQKRVGVMGAFRPVPEP